MKEINLVNSDLKAKVDDEDFTAVNAHKWYLDHETGYAFRMVGQEGDIEYMHDFILRRVARWN